MNPAPHPLYDAPDFESFWRAYVMAHRSPATQRAHAVATTLMLACVAQGVRTRRLRWFALAPLVDYVIAQSSHRVVEHNRTQPWRDTPRHLRAELRMWRYTLTGRMAREVERVEAELR
jgi:hypothetical protein